MGFWLFSKIEKSIKCVTQINKAVNILVHLYFLGFMTTKGELVRSILFPPPLDFQFHRDFLKSIYVFLSLGTVVQNQSFHLKILLFQITQIENLYVAIICQLDELT